MPKNKEKAFLNYFRFRNSQQRILSLQILPMPCSSVAANRNHRDGFSKELLQGKPEIMEKNLAAFVSADKKLSELCNEQCEKEN